MNKLAILTLILSISALVFIGSTSQQAFSAKPNYNPCLYDRTMCLHENIFPRGDTIITPTITPITALSKLTTFNGYDIYQLSNGNFEAVIVGGTYTLNLSESFKLGDVGSTDPTTLYGLLNTNSHFLPQSNTPTCDLNKYDHSCTAPTGLCYNIRTLLTNEYMSDNTIAVVLNDLHCS